MFGFGVNFGQEYDIISVVMDLSALREVLLAPDFDAERYASEIIQSGAAATESRRAELHRAEAEIDANLQEQVGVQLDVVELI